MLLIHPLIQLIATLLDLYVLLLGVDRFRRLHLQQKTVFKWKRHVRAGTFAMLLLLFGLVFGLIMVKVSWHGLFITGSHGDRIYIILPLIFFSLLSGWYMHIYKKQRIILPLIHGSGNLLLIILVLLQAITGWQVYNAFVLGN